LMPRSSRQSVPFRISKQNFLSISHLSNVCYMPHSTLIWSL
jgi:hypothetical protein